MTTIDLLRELRDLGIKVRIDEDQLAIKAPTGALTPELAARIRENKAEILAFLRDAESAPAGDSKVESLKGLADPTSPPISPDQRKEWHLQRLDPGSPVYNAAGAFRLRGPLDRDALRGALQTMVDRHSVLRSRFVETNREPVLVIDDHVQVEIFEEDLTGIPEAEREAAMRAFLEEAADEILDLEKGPPFRARLATMGPEDHAFFFLAHSILWDGWSFDLLLKEMTAHYEAHLEGRTDALPPLPIQYIDYAAWQNLRLERGDFRPHLEFWRKRLRGPIPPLHVPSDRPRRPESDYLGARVWSKVEKATLEGLRVLTRAEGATLYMVLLAALDVLLHRYTGAKDVVVSSPLQGRTHPELEDLIGAFTNTLFFRTSIDPDESFRSLLRRVKDICLEAVDHQEAPANQVIQIMDEEGLGRAPYEVIFVFQQAADRPTKMGPVSVKSIPRGTRVVPVDLMMWAREYDDYLDGGVDYRTSLFDDERMQRLISHYQRLLDSIGRNPDLPVKELSILGEEELRQLQEWGSGAPPSGEIAGGPAPRAPVLGEGARVRSGSAIISEAQIRDGIEGMKRVIKGVLSSREGENGDQKIALAFDGSLETLAAMEAARELSAPLVLFHPEAAAPEISRKMSQLGARHLLVGPDSSLSETEGLENVTRLELGTVLEIGDEDPVWNPGAGGVYFGSGGPEEGVGSSPYPWESMEREISGLIEFLGLDSDVGVALYLDGPPERWAPVTLATLTAGGTLFLAEPGQPPDGWELDELVETGEISVLVAGSRAAEQLVDTGWEAQVERVLVGDAHAPGSLLESLSRRSREVGIGWGMPAVGGWVLLGKAGEEEGLSGRPLRRTAWSPPLAILDPAGQRLPQGIPGELWIGTLGDSLPDTPSGGGTIPTGQLVRWLGDGTLALEGRRDRWETLNGHYVDLAETGSDLRNLEPVLDAHLQVLEQGGQRRLVAHLVSADPDGQIDEGLLRDTIGGRGVLFTKQVSFAIHSELPRTADGQIDERALATRFEHASRDRSETEPRSPEEQALAEIWREVLGLPEVGIDDKFFDLGGHSLLAVQVTLKLEEEKGLRIDPRTLFFESLGQVAAGAVPVPAKTPPGG